MAATETIECLLKQDEGLNIEFKQARTRLPNDLFESICAFLNRQDGHLLLGAENDSTPIGVDTTALDALQRDSTALREAGPIEQDLRTLLTAKR